MSAQPNPRCTRPTRDGPYRTAAERPVPRRPRRGGVDWSSIVLLLPALVIGIALLASAGRREPFSQRAAGAGTVMVIVAGGLIASELRDGWRRRHEPRQDECDRTDDRWRR